jgi:hypothetical protein
MAKKTKPKKEREHNYEKKLAVKGTFLDLINIAVKVDKPKEKKE